MLTWATGVGLVIPPALGAFYESMRLRPAVQLARRHEGLD